jgi:hypothetical protein
LRRRISFFIENLTRLDIISAQPKRKKGIIMPSKNRGGTHKATKPAKVSDLKPKKDPKGGIIAILIGKSSAPTTPK